MDLLHKPLSQVGDLIYFIISSVEEPYYYVRFRGEIMEVSVSETQVTYRIKPKEILETYDVIRSCICGKHFRIRNIKASQRPFVDYMIKCRANVADTDMISVILRQMEKRWFDVSIMTTFLTEDNMNDKLSSVNKYNIDVLTRRVDFLSKRNLNL